MNISQVNKIYLTDKIHKKIIDHCFRKLSGNYLSEETPEPQAYGLLWGKIKNLRAYISEEYICKSNYRNTPGVQNYINELVEKYAIPAETPVNERGWVVNPTELLEATNKNEKLGLDLIGSYHMHHEDSWTGDKPKEYPSEFDAKLAENTGLLMFIISIKKMEYSIKGFYEGLKHRELEIVNYVTE